VGLLAGACGPGPDDLLSSPGDAVDANATVVRVVDGDTVVVRLGRNEEHVRLIGIDTPETVDPRRPAECFGKEASERTGSLLPAGTRVRLERDAEGRDRYDRLLAYLYRAEDGAFVNLSMVADGFALAKPYPPNTAHQAAFGAAEAEARRRGVGLWGACGDVGT